MFNLPLRLVTKTKLSGAASSFSFTDFSGIPSGSRHLGLILNARDDSAGTDRSVAVRYNNDSGANYHKQYLFGSGAVASAERSTGGTSMADQLSVPGSTAAANAFGGGMIVIPHYANTANHKAELCHSGAAEKSVIASTGRWANVAAITRVDLLAAGNFVTNSIALFCVVDERYLVEEQALSGDGTVTFSSIPQTPGDLCTIGYCRTDRASVLDDVDVSVNADVTDANYARQLLYGDSTTAASVAAASRDLIHRMPGDTATANAFGTFVLSISQHANGVKQPHYLVVAGYHESSGPNSFISVTSARRANIAAVTSLAFTPGAGGTNFKSGSLFSLYYVPKRLIDYQKLTADAASITHTVPSGYEALKETIFTRSDVVGARDGVNVAFNNDTTLANYDQQYLQGDGTVVTAESLAADRSVMSIPGASAAANVFGGGLLLIPAYTETDRHKHMVTIDAPADDLVNIRSCRWENSAAITEIDFTPVTGPNFEGN